ncbi:MAG TPA: hypothetical protein ENI26_07820 [Methylophaga aminisulfidivorans]|uniref:Uncharacterized protein n=2 Tax=root TaxID=1 RepID=A0A7C1ZQD9_9GAMM|nr:hypothetical protein [Methylophaga sp.]HEC74263.1 hypothetical protein [Methylophaga aminisulfidivorans]
MTDKSKSHDVFDGEIPKDIGKKKSPPVWIKIILLLILVSVLGTAVYILESDNEYDIEPGVDLNETVISELTAENPIINEVNTTNNNEAEKESIQESNLDILELENTQNEIQVIPSNTAQPSSNTAGFYDEKSELDVELADLSTRLDTIEDKESDRIALVKSGMELHAESINKLNALVGSLKELKSELKALKRESTKTNGVAQPSHLEAQKKLPKTDIPNKPNAISKTDQLKLLGIDSWGGEDYAQIEYKNEIHLLSTTEKIGKWKVMSIDDNSVMIKNEEGVSFELKI